MDKLKLGGSMLIFGTIGIFTHYIPLSSTLIALIRAVIGVVFLLVLTLAQNRRVNMLSVRNNLLLLALSGAAMGFNWICLFEAYNYTSIAVATLCYYFSPVIVTLLSPILLHEKLTPVKLVCVLLALVGMVFVSGIITGGVYGVKGILLGLAGACLYASIILMNRFMRGITPMDSTIMQLSFAAITLLPYAIITKNFASIDCSTVGWLHMAFIGIVHTGIAYALYFGAVRHLRAQTVALYSYIDPVFAIILSALLLNQPLDIWGIAGAVLILGSTLFSELYRR